MTTQSQTLSTPKTAQGEFQTGQVLTIVSGHFVHDTFSAFVAPLLPLIIEKLSLSLTLAGSLWGFVQIPALLNPFIGYLADRLSLRYFVILAPAVTATLMSLIGLAPNYPTLAVLLLTVGISVAAFHAPAPAMVARISGKQLGQGMSWFMAAGELGRTVGPLLAVWAVSTWTLDNFHRVMVLGWACSLLLYWRLRDIPARTDKRQDLRAVLPAMRRLFVPILGVVIPRQVLLTALAVYLPTFMSLEGASLWTGGALLSMWEFAGVGGALTGGTLSDRLGRKPILWIVMSSAPMFMLLFLNASGWLLVPVLIVLGFTSLASAPVLLAMVQENQPDNRALANGLFLSMTFLIRPIAAFGIGLLGDNFGLRAAYYWVAIFSLIAIPAIYFLPSRDNEEHETPQL
jgi:FSR family fosmidomycin resistance protein-like MFS transporter